MGFSTKRIAAVRRPPRDFLALAAMFLSLVIASTPIQAHTLRVAFYGARPPVRVLRAFQWIVVQPSAAFSPRKFDNAHNLAFAYTSAGEVSHAAGAPRPPAGCILGHDTDWHSAILSEAQSVCRQYYLHQVFAPLWKKGYRGFFLDNLDSYEQVVKNAKGRQRERRGLIRLISEIKAAHPHALLILNRGFQILPSVHKLVAAVTAESLFYGWDQQTHEYSKVRKATRQRLIQKLRKAQDLGLPTIAIDYLPPKERARAQADALQIKHLNITPWVTNHSLTMVGVGSITVMPRKILMLYSGSQDAQHTSLNWYAAMPLNYLGYSTRIINIAQGLPSGTLTGQYAGIVTWFENNHVPHSTVLRAWLRRQIHNGVPIAVLGNCGFALNRHNFKILGITAGPAPRHLDPNRIVAADAYYVGFETPALPAGPDDFVPLLVNHGHALLRLRDIHNHYEDAVALTSWGGYALSPDVINYLGAVPGPKNKSPAAWIINPFHFFTKALRLPVMPVPDTTTESGRRMLMAQIDGDGFANKSWIYHDRDQYAGQVILQKILEKYRIPTSASFIVSYFTPNGLFPHHAAQLTAIARRIAALPWVEIGSHTFSHPFNWPALEHNPALMGHKGNMRYGYALSVPGYTRFSAAKEITGSVRWINKHLAPPGKAVSILQWSGDCDPSARVLALTYSDHLFNLNGGGATETDGEPFITKVRGLGLFKGHDFQVYAPMGDENAYTHSWTSPYYYGYLQVLQTFKLTDAPRRLKPLDIYYHFYSGARVAGLRALRTVLSWALKQRTDPVFPSHFAHIAVDFGRLVVARSNHGWLIHNAGAVQEFRIPVSAGYPQLRDTTGIAGFDHHNQVRYIHVAPLATIRIRLTPKRPTVAFLHDANATVTQAYYQGSRLHFALTGHNKLQFRLANMHNCRVTENDRTLPGRYIDHLMTYNLDTRHGHFAVICP